MYYEGVVDYLEKTLKLHWPEMSSTKSRVM